MRKARPHPKNPRVPGRLEILALAGIPEILPGDPLARILVAAARRSSMAFRHGDVLVVAQKIVSKAEGALVRLSSVVPGRKARALGRRLGKDPRLVEVILGQSRRVVRLGPKVMIVETRSGLVCANAGVDQSNIPGEDAVTLLPRNADRSARRLAREISRRTGKRVAVVVSDTFGRAWRLGQTNVAIGAAGVPVLFDLRGGKDRLGKPLHATILAVADDLAAAAGLLMGKAAGRPAVILRGFAYPRVFEPAAAILRPAGEDLFR